MKKLLSLFIIVSMVVCTNTSAFFGASSPTAFISLNQAMHDSYRINYAGLSASLGMKSRVAPSIASEFITHLWDAGKVLVPVAAVTLAAAVAYDRYKKLMTDKASLAADKVALEKKLASEKSENQSLRADCDHLKKKLDVECQDATAHRQHKLQRDNEDSKRSSAVSQEEQHKKLQEEIERSERDRKKLENERAQLEQEKKAWEAERKKAQDEIWNTQLVVNHNKDEYQAGNKRIQEREQQLEAEAKTQEAKNRVLIEQEQRLSQLRQADASRNGWRSRARTAVLGWAAGMTTAVLALNPDCSSSRYDGLYANAS